MLNWVLLWANQGKNFKLFNTIKFLVYVSGKYSSRKTFLNLGLLIKKKIEKRSSDKNSTKIEFVQSLNSPLVMSL